MLTHIHSSINQSFKLWNFPTSRTDSADNLGSSNRFIRFLGNHCQVDKSTHKSGDISSVGDAHFQIQKVEIATVIEHGAKLCFNPGTLQDAWSLKLVDECTGSNQKGDWIYGPMKTAGRPTCFWPRSSSDANACLADAIVLSNVVHVLVLVPYYTCVRQTTYCI